MLAPGRQATSFSGEWISAFECTEPELVSGADAALGSKIPFATVTIGPPPD
jgi:hypothetical protein